VTKDKKYIVGGFSSSIKIFDINKKTPKAYRTYNKYDCNVTEVGIQMDNN
jgi:hypothetical protein